MSTLDLTAAPFLVARQNLRTALAAVTVPTTDGPKTLDVYLYGSANLATPCAVIEPDGFAPAQASGTVVAYTVKVTVLYNAATPSEAMDGSEELARLVYKACAAAGWLPVNVPAPSAITWNERGYVGVQFVVGTRNTI